MPQGGVKTASGRTGRGIAALVLLLAAWLLPGQALAQDARKGRIDVRSAYTELQNGVFYLSARVEYRLSRQALEALDKGVSLNVELQINVTQMRRFIWDDSVATLRQRYELSFHALTQRFVVLNLNSGEKRSFGDLETALANLGTVERLPVIDAALLDDDDDYEIALRSILDIKELPASVRLLSLVWGDWRVASDWYRWRLRP
jgi:hypothetical protein